MAERQIGHRKSSLVLSVRFPVFKWRSRSVANAGRGPEEVYGGSRLYQDKLDAVLSPLQF